MRCVAADGSTAGHKPGDPAVPCPSSRMHHSARTYRCFDEGQQTLARTAGIESHPANAAAAYTQHRPPRTRTIHRTRAAFAGSPRLPQDVFRPRQPCPLCTSCDHEREVDSPFVAGLVVVFLAVAGAQQQGRSGIVDGARVERDEYAGIRRKLALAGARTISLASPPRRPVPLPPTRRRDSLLTRLLVLQ